MTFRGFIMDEIKNTSDSIHFAVQETPFTTRVLRA
jgi:hypothetical protein